SVSTVEHLMAALAGAGVSDALILIDGPEVPILDGSSLLFTRALARAGLRRLTVKQPAIRVLKPVVVEDGGRTARLLPLADDAISSLEVTFEIRFDDPAIGQQKYGLRITPDAFAEELAECRTFCHLAEVEGLRKIGLARGGGLDNAIVVDRGRVLNPEGLRRPDEFVRHKMLDAVGDLALAGAPIIGRYEGVLAGHEMTNRLLHALFEAEESWEWVDHQPLIRTARRPYTLRPGEGAALAV
ncbi:MAG: UDP-3-O-acyl-N-acetylglucosamine deacetylase, partial [Pseudomonadota bacterium]